MLKFLITLIATLVSAAAFAAVDVNKASQAELETLKGVGPVMSGKLMAERQKSPFADWNDLVDRVKGVGPGNAVKLSAQGLTVNGTEYAPSTSTKPAKTRKGAGEATKAKSEKPTRAAKGQAKAEAKFAKPAQ